MYDVIVLGGGVVGASAADALARRGCRTLIIEQREPAHDRGSSHGDGRMIRYDYSEPVYVEMVRQSYEAWEEVARRGGEALLQQTGICNFGPAGSSHLAELETNLSAFHIPYERLTAAESNTRFPQYRLDPESETLYQPDGGVLFAGQAVRCLWRLAQANGAEAITGERIESLNIHRDRIRITACSGRSWSAERLVLAAGSWSGAWLNRLDLRIPLSVTQEQLAYFPVKDGVDHSAGVMPNCIDYHTPQPFYCLPQITVPGVKAGWHHTGPEIDPDHPLPVDEANLVAVQAFIRRRCPHLEPTPVVVQHCLYTNSLDYHFILDRHPVYPQIVIAAGFSGHGFKFGPVLGRILTALAFDESPPVPLDMFAIDRFAQPRKLRQRTIA